jgi:hypothetical protein
MGDAFMLIGGVQAESEQMVGGALRAGHAYNLTASG